MNFMKLSYQKPEIEVHNYSLLQDVSCGLSGDILDPANTYDVKNEELFK